MSDVVAASQAWLWSEATKVAIVLGVGFVGIAATDTGLFKVQKRSLLSTTLSGRGPAKPIQKRSRTEANYERFTCLGHA